MTLIRTLLLFALVPTAVVASPESVDLPPIQHQQAELTVVDGQGREATYSPAQLEELPTYRLETTTPWRDVPARFDGIMLRDLLAAHDLDQHEAVRVSAENDYQVIIPQSLWEDVDVLIATRVNGKPHSRRNRGPLQFVIDMDAYENSDVALQDHMVWMASKIEPVEANP